MGKLRLSLVKVGGGRKVLRLSLLLLLSLIFSSLLSPSDAKRSACWRYGHSCWGGHGKRSGGLGEGRPGDDESKPEILYPRPFGGFGFLEKNSDPPVVPLRMVHEFLRANVNGVRNPNLNSKSGLQFLRGQRLQEVVGVPPTQQLFPIHHHHPSPLLLHKVKREESDDDDTEFEASQQDGQRQHGNLQEGENKESRENQRTFTSSSNNGMLAADSSIFVRDRKPMDSTGSEDFSLSNSVSQEV